MAEYDGSVESTLDFYDTSNKTEKQYAVNYETVLDFSDTSNRTERQFSGGFVQPAAGGGGPGVVYRMRGFDQNGAVNNYVYWDSSEVDSDASDYSGSAGPVVDIVVHKVIGA